MVRVQTDLVALDVQVRDRQGRVVSELTKDDFIVTEDWQSQTIGHFSLEVGLLQPPDPTFYFAPMIPEHASDGVKRTHAITSRLENKLLDKEVKPYSLTDVYKAVEKSRATVYTIIPGEQLIGISPNEQFFKVRMDVAREYSNDQVRQIQYCILRAQKAADGAAAVSGGWTAFLDKPEAAPDIYSSILADINSRYLLGYYPANKVHDGRRRLVTVAVRGHPEYVISGRRSYYAPEPEP
ncbi:MAG TPA: hypothetical protein DC054_23885 [Blastocatellia bacterium]|nr:hypothetical protein [Blastocatellia bacterium]